MYYLWLGLGFHGSFKLRPDIDHILGNGNSKQGEKVRQHMETIAQKLGLKLNWVSSNKQSNGFYDPQTKTITIAADAENPLAAVFGHETVHRLKEMNVEAFNSLVALAKEILGSSFDAEAARVESRYRKAGMNYDTAYYEEEAVCDFVGDMIDNQNLLERICWDANHKVLSALRNIFDKILAAIGIKDARLMHIRTVISAAYEQSVRNDESSKLTTGNEVKRDSLKRKDEVDEKSSGYFKKHPDAMSESVFAQAQKDMDDIAEWMNPYYDATAMGNRLLPEEQYGRKGAASTIFANGSYGKTMENTLKCIRTLAYNQFTDDVKKQLGRPLTQKESFLASQMVYDIATDPQCLYCYVSLDRKAYDDFLLKYVQQKEDVLDKFRSLPQDEKSAAAKGAPHTALKELYAEFLANRKDTKNMQARFNMWIRNEMAGNRSVKASDLITAETRRAILDGLDTSLAREVRDAEKYAQGASWAKKDVDYISYVGELLKLSPAWIKKLTGEYGLRFYSFSEYTPAFILENMQMVRDASLRGLNGLGYTKELDFVKIFAPTGMNINCSVYGRMDNEGNMHMDTLQGADWEEVKQLRSKYNNVGAVFVATNDASVDWALNQDWIDVIIPFHIVRTGADIAEFYGWDNHMRDQSDHFADSSKTMYVSPVEHQNDKEKFLEACKKHGLIPRFEKWMNHPNYMRLVNETRLSVNETRPIKPIFDMTEAKDSWDRFVNRGGYYNGWWQVSPEEYANNVRTVVEDIRSGKMANEVEYGRQDMPANPERMIAAARKKRIHGNVPLVDVFDRSGNVLGRKAESSNGAVLFREDSENSNHPYEVFTGNEAIERLNAFFDIRPRDLPTLLAPINSLDAFKELFANPVRTVLGTLIKVKDGVFNKMARKEREKIAGAVLPTLQDADFVIKDIDGSYLYVKRYKNAENEHIYNVVVVNKHDEVEEYISSVHIKSNNNLRNKIEKGAELLIPSKRTRYGVQAPSNSTPAANIAQNPDTANTPQREDAESPATEAQITQAANRTAGSLHLDNVTILSEEDLASLTPKQRSAKGWFDPKTGRIYINASNHANEADVVQTVLHEAVAHYGLRALFGKDFDTMLDRVYRAAGSEIRQHIHELMRERSLSRRAATEEYLASLAENTRFDRLSARVWNEIKHAFRDLLAKLGITTEITDDELRYLLWRSYDLLRGDRDTLKSKVRDAAMQYELGVGNYGDMYRTTINLPDARSRYDHTVRSGDHWYNNFGYKFYEGHVEAMAPARALVDAIQAVSGNRPIQTYENFLAEENRLSSKNMAEQKRFRRLYIDPMRKAVNDFKIAAGLTYEDLKKYVILKHGLERNEIFAKRDTDAKFAHFNDAVKAQFAQGKITLSESTKLIADIDKLKIEHYNKLRETKDYSGITTLMAIDNLPDAEAAAADLIKKIEDGNEAKRDEMWEKINDLTQATLQKRLDTGLISQRQFDELSKMFAFYVPLQGWDKKTAEEMYDYSKEYMTMPGTVRIHHANGRRSVAGDPLAQLEYNADHVIAAGIRNVMKQTFANFVGARPTNLATVSRAWYTLDPSTGEWVATWPDVDPNLSGQLQQAQLAQFEADMEAKEANGEAKRMTSDLRTAHPMANPRDHKREHTVNVLIGGQEYRVYIHGNPAAAQAINGVRPQLGAVARALHSFKNLQSRLLTSLNPAFTLPNLVRDSIWTLTMMVVNERPAYLKHAIKYGNKLIYSGNPLKPHHYWTDRLIYRYEHDQLDDNDEIDRMFGEFMTGGGETGFAALRSIDDYRTDLRKYLEHEANKGKINAKRVAQLGTKAAKLIGAELERINRDAELTNRFITYMASRKSGRSVQQSVIDAKNITINFNRHGSGNYLGAYCQGAYYFYNAAVQALYTTQQSAKHNPVKALVGIGITPMMVGAFVAMACAYGSGDDDGYYDIPDWERKANVCITIGGGKYVKIPLPPELRVFYAIGEGFAAMAAGKQSATETMTSAITELAGLLPLDMTGHGGNPLANLAPSVTQPITDTFVFNRDFLGLPIYNDSDYGRWDPEYTKAYRNTPQAYIELSRVINNLTGGSDIRKSKFDTILTNPSVIQYIFEGYTGNMVKLANETANTVENIKNDEIEIGRIPISRRFFSDIDERAQGRNANNEYRELHDIYEQVQHDVSKLRRQYEDARAAGDEQAMDDAVNKMQTLRQSDDFATYAYFKLTKADKYIRHLRKTANNPYLDREQSREAEHEITTVKRNIIDHHQQFVDDFQKK